jgi:hypothetical protein
MAGAITQVVSRGPHDDPLTTDPEISLFQSFFEPYETFGLETLAINSTGQVSLGKEWKYTFPKTGDLIAGGCIEFNFSAVSVKDNIGAISGIHQKRFYMIKTLKFEVGQYPLVTHDGRYLDIMYRMDTEPAQREAILDMINGMRVYTTYGAGGSINKSTFDSIQVPQKTIPAHSVLLPLRFSWCKDFTQALTIGALAYNDVILEVDTKSSEDLYIKYDGAEFNNEPQISDAKLYLEYIFFDRSVRNRFLNAKHFFIFHQMQSNVDIPVNSESFEHIMRFSMPCSGLVILFQEADAIKKGVQRYDFYDQYDGNETMMLPKAAMNSMKMSFTTAERFRELKNNIFTRFYAIRHYKSVDHNSRSLIPYPFGLAPFTIPPNGSANFSRIENPTVTSKLNNMNSNVIGKSHFYATIINFMTIQKGATQLFFNS